MKMLMDDVFNIGQCPEKFYSKFPQLHYQNKYFGALYSCNFLYDERNHICPIFSKYLTDWTSRDTTLLYVSEQGVCMHFIQHEYVSKRL